MPRPSSAFDLEGIPFWDTFEVFYFLIAGISVGIVLGFLFPSLWRTVRRRFRNIQKFAPPGFEKKHLFLKHLPLAFDEQEDFEKVTRSIQNLDLLELITVARSLLQQSHERYAIAVYLKVLSHEKISKHQTLHMLFELSQAYVNLALYSRGLDTLFELLHRKPKDRQVFEYSLLALEKSETPERVFEFVEVYRGAMDEQLRLRCVDIAVRQISYPIAIGNKTQTLQNLRRLIRFDPHSARPQILLWQITSDELWHKPIQNYNFIEAFEADIQALIKIHRETKISIACVARVACDLILKFENVDNHLYALERLAALPEKSFLFYVIVFHFYEHWKNLSEAARLKCIAVVEQNFAREAIVFSQKSPIFPALQGYILHRCRVCNEIALEFCWLCSKCKSCESFELHWHGFII